MPPKQHSSPISPFEPLELEQVAKLLDCSVRTVRELIQLGRLPAMRIGGKMRVVKRDVDEYLEQSRPR